MRLRKLPAVRAKSFLVLGCAAGLVSLRAAAQVPGVGGPALGGAGALYPGAAAGPAGPVPGPGAPGGGPRWALAPAIAVSETYSDNANLAPTNQQKSSFITSVTPSLGVIGNGRRVQLNGTVAVQALLYRGEFEQTQIYPRANLLGSVEAIEKFFYVEGSANVYQTYLSAFGPQPVGNIGQTNNRYTQQTYRVSPYITGRAPGQTTYFLRNDNVWTTLGNTPSGTPGLNGSYFDQWTGRIVGPVRTVSGTAEFFTTYTKFPNQPSIDTKLVRAILNYRPIPQELRLFADGGYEWNNYTFQQTQDAIYGAGFEWHPSLRTQLSGAAEHRFFGWSYLGTFNHRNPYSALTLSASRNVFTYPQQLLALPAGANVASLLDAVFTAKIPDPVERAAAVQEFMRQAGLPDTLQSSVTLYTQQAQLATQGTASFALIGLRSVLAFTTYYLKSQVVSGATGTPLPPVAGIINNNNNTQVGGAITYSYRLTLTTSVGATATHFWSQALPPLTTKSTTDVLQLFATTRFGTRTDGFAGASYSKFDSSAAASYNAATVVVGVAHRF